MIKKLTSGKKPEYAVFVLFLGLYCLISAFHEPWFDEAQAWEIAKGASFKDILLLIPHYEGHPPLWHLLLAIPAKLGVPFELGLKSVGLLVSAATAWLLLFRSKLPRFVRLSLPFSYFVFYQYGVIVRPYGLMLLVLLLLGMQLGTRKEHPWRVFFLLLLLCLLSAYGILLAGGISLCILWELWREKGTKRLFTELLRDPSTQTLLCLLAAAVVLLPEILPRENTYATEFEDQNPFWLCLLCALLTFPGDCLLTTASWFSVDRSLLQTSRIGAIELAGLSVIGALLWVLILSASSKRSLKYLLVPYALFAVFSAKVYFSGHHLGVVFSLLLFWAELIARDEKRFELGRALKGRIIKKEQDARLLRWAYRLVGLACLVIPLVWTANCSFNELRYEYYYSRSIAEFLKETGLDQTRILEGWHEDGEKIPQAEGDEDYVNTVMIGTAVHINAYFKQNICFNLNHGGPQGFIYHMRPSLTQSRSDLARWRAEGAPDVIIGKPDLGLVYESNVDYSDYSLVFVRTSRFLWKFDKTPSGMPVFLRNDLLEQYHLKALTGKEYMRYYGMPLMNDEMREQYEAGVPLEEIIAPYLDAYFGVE